MVYSQFYEKKKKGGEQKKMSVDVSGIAGDVYGIVGTGIGLGVLAGTSGMVMRSMERNIYGRPYRPIYDSEEEEEYRRPRTRTYKKRKTSKKRKTTRKKPTRRDEYVDYGGEESESRPRPRYGSFSPYGSSRLNIPRYW